MIAHFTTCLLLGGLAVANSPHVSLSEGVSAIYSSESVRDEAPAELPADGPLTIKQVMRYAMTQHLCKKVIKNKATPEEQQRLVELFEALAKCKPPVGSEESWNEKTAALVDAAKEVAAGKPAQKQLMEAANCAACHNAHRPK